MQLSSCTEAFYPVSAVVSLPRMSETLSLSEAELQALTRRQLELEQQIRGKAHSLYVDEVVCTRLWRSVVIHTF